MDLHESQPARKDRRTGDDGDEPIELAKSWRRAAWLWSLLAFLAGLTLLLVIYQQQQQRRQTAQSFIHEEMAGKTYAELQGRLHAAEDILRAVQTLYLASDEVTEDEFTNAYANLRPRERFPSLLALTFAAREAGPAGDQYIIRWVEPSADNAALLGLDAGSQPNNLAGVLISRDTDQATLSAPFHLIQAKSSIPAVDGITFALPVFTAGRSPTSVEQRRQRILGSIAVSFRVGTLIGNALPDDVARELNLQLSDVTDPAHALPLFESAPDADAVTSGYHFERLLAYGGRTWKVTMRPRQADSASNWLESVLPGGLLASLLLALLVYSIVSTRQRALELGWQMSRRYRESEERFRALNELLPALVLLAEVGSGQITYANHAARDRLGDQLKGYLLSDLFEDRTLCEQLQHADVGGCERVEVQLHSDAGMQFWASVAISRVELNGHDKLLMVASDTSEQRQLTELLSHQASHDELTGLYNRREFERRLHDALAAISADSAAAVLLYVDLDQFKLINDTSGHLAGDQLLAQLAIVMRKQLGDTDVLARLGGDEFGVLLVGVVDQPQGERIAERLRRCIDGYVFIWEQHSYMISASIGGVAADRPGLSVRDLLTHADTACYMAKESGRNRVHFYSERDDQAVRRRSEMEWANRLRWAVDEHRLELAYQEVWPLPLTSGDEPGIEVLLRFREASGELLLPGVFLPAAERYGLMPIVDRWVIETTLANFDRLHAAGRRLDMVAINLSGASLEDVALADWIIELLQRYQVEPSRVCFEITETVAVRNLSQVVPCMERLRSIGCRIALDDFGAGMSSFTYLKNLPLDIIKIDGSFVRDMLTDPVSHLMVKAVTDIGHRLGLEVIAEWVADAQTVQALTELGVNWVQGFSLHRPEPALFHRD